MNRIVVDRGIGKKLAEICNCSEVYVSMALNAHRDSDLVRLIRYLALKKFNGVEIKKKKK